MIDIRAVTHVLTKNSVSMMHQIIALKNGSFFDALYKIDKKSRK